MKTLKSTKTILTLAIVLLIGSAAFAALPMWSVKGVIDWNALGYGQNKPTPKVYEEGWNVLNGDLPSHAARDGVIFVPRAQDIDADVPFGTLAGGAALILVKPIDPDYIDWYEIWYWEDVNNDGQADPQDTINGQEQNWTLLVHQDGPPSSNYDTVTGRADIANLLKSGVNLKSGKSYLLLLRVHAHIPADENGRYDSDEGTSLQFTSPVTLEGSQIRVDYTAKLPQEGWSATDAPLKYLSASGNSIGVADFEVLQVRVNNPPAYPVVP